MLQRMVVRSLLGTALMGILLFGSAGTLAWPAGWLFLLSFCLYSLAIGLWLWRADPDLLAARMKSPVSADQRPFDRLVIVLIMAFFAAWLVLMAFDAERFGWSRVPPWVHALGGGLVLVAFCGWVAVLRANSFAAVTVQVQQARHQTVISSGPYAAVRHPMYSFALLFALGVPLLLGSLWGLGGFLLITGLFVLRTVGEETVLRQGLAGYADYQARVRYRLIPGVW